MVAKRGPLRSVGEGETAKPAKPQTVAQAAESGDQRSLLVAMRARIARTVSDPECPPRDLASLTKRLGDIADQIKALDAQAEEDAENEREVPDEEFDASAL